MIYDLDSPQDSKEDIAAAKEDARKLLRQRTKWAIYATVAIFLSCVSVVPFLYGYPLHTYWESFGKFFLLLSMGMLLVFVFFTGTAFNAWFFVREVEKIEE